MCVPLRLRDRVRLIRNANLFVVPGLLMIAVLPGWSGLLGVAVTGVALYVPFSLHLTLGQDCIPTGWAPQAASPSDSPSAPADSPRRHWALSPRQRPYRWPSPR
ncbi:hypothetical protein JD76_03194 [Micromonospora endolithica]|nr:hypothetical protein JD76_03194 [Micromonospora endolithica]